MLTLDELKNMEPHKIIKIGVVIDSLIGINMTNTGKQLMYVVKRGFKHDWTIYVHWKTDDIDNNIKYVITHGDKVTKESNIKKLMPCDDDVFALYRY